MTAVKTGWRQTEQAHRICVELTGDNPCWQIHCHLLYVANCRFHPAWTGPRGDDRAHEYTVFSLATYFLYNGVVITYSYQHKYAFCPVVLIITWSSRHKTIITRVPNWTQKVNCTRTGILAEAAPEPISLLFLSLHQTRSEENCSRRLPEPHTFARDLHKHRRPPFLNLVFFMSTWAGYLYPTTCFSTITTVSVPPDKISSP